MWESTLKWLIYGKRVCDCNLKSINVNVKRSIYIHVVLIACCKQVALADFIWSLGFNKWYYYDSTLSFDVLFNY